MKKTGLFFVILILLISLTNISTAQNNTISYSSRPIYSINTYNGDIEVNGGEDVELRIFIIGVGTPDYAMMFIQAPSDIFEPEMDLRVLQNITLTYDNTMDGAHIDYSNDKSRTRVLFTIPQIFFSEPPYNSQFNLGGIEASGVNEKDVRAPIMANLKVKDNAKPGDYQAALTLYYNQSEEWYVDEKIVNIHIRDWTEKWWGKFLIYGSAAAAILGLYLNAEPTIQKYLKKIRDKK